MAEMTKQREIREGIAMMSYNISVDVSADRAMPNWKITGNIASRNYQQADYILKYLHSQGVVITKHGFYGDLMESLL